MQVEGDSFILKETVKESVNSRNFRNKSGENELNPMKTASAFAFVNLMALTNNLNFLTFLTCMFEWIIAA